VASTSTTATTDDGGTQALEAPEVVPDPAPVVLPDPIPVVVSVDESDAPVAVPSRVSAAELLGRRPVRAGRPRRAHSRRRLVPDGRGARVLTAVAVGAATATAVYAVVSSLR
jgi:hypothetical protein